MSQSSNPNTLVREFALQFLYQCESEKLYHFAENHFRSFAQHQQLTGQQTEAVRELARGTLEAITDLDVKIQDVSANWKLSRMSIIDRNVLRLATFELGLGQAPMRVVLNEAVDLAKKFGSEESGRFVNGLLDRIAKTARLG